MHKIPHFLTFLFTLYSLWPSQVFAFECRLSFDNEEGQLLNSSSPITFKKYHRAGMEIRETTLQAFLYTPRLTKTTLTTTLALNPATGEMELLTFDQFQRWGLREMSTYQKLPSQNTVSLDVWGPQTPSGEKPNSFKITCDQFESSMSEKSTEHASTQHLNKTNLTPHFRDLNTFPSELTKHLPSHVEITGENFLFITHANRIYENFQTEKGLKKILEKPNTILGLKKSNLTKIGLSLDGLTTRYTYSFDTSKMDYWVESALGGMQLSLPQAKNVFLSGGFLHSCLCETLRDVIRYTNPAEVIDIHLLTDAIYMSSQTDPDQVILAHSFFSTPHLADQLNWLKRYIWGEESLCLLQPKLQYEILTRTLVNSEIALEIHHHLFPTQPVIKFGEGPRKVRLHIR